MDDLQKIEGLTGLYKIKKVKQLYYLGYGERIVYMINLDNQKIKYKEIKRSKNVI